MNNAFILNSLYNLPSVDRKHDSAEQMLRRRPVFEGSSVCQIELNYLLI